MNKKKLYLLMQAFPLKDRETPFIAPELPFLKEQFDVTVVPMEEVGISPLTRAVALAKSLLSPLVYTETVKGIKQGKKATKVFTFNLFVMWRAQCYASYLRKNVFESKEATVYTYWYNELALGALLLKNAYPEYKFVTRCHGYDLYDFRLPSDYQPYKEYMDDLLDKVVFISHMGKKYYLERYRREDCDKYSIAYLGVSRQEKKLHEDSDTLHLVSCSNVIPVKRVPLICDALSLIKDINIVWHHFGNGSDMDNIKQLVKLLPENISVNLMGRVPNSEYMDWLKDNPADLFINVSSSEGLPVSLMEASSFGIPSIATDVGGSREIVSEENGILLCSDPDAETVAASIKEFFRMPADKKQQLGNNSYLKWQNNFNSAVNSKKFTDSLASL